MMTEHMENKSWTERMSEVICTTNPLLDADKFLVLLEEDWGVEEYMEAVANLGEPSLASPNGWKRAELVNSLIIEYLKNGAISPYY